MLIFRGVPHPWSHHAQPRPRCFFTAPPLRLRRFFADLRFIAFTCFRLIFGIFILHLGYLGVVIFCFPICDLEKNSPGLRWMPTPKALYIGSWVYNPYVAISGVRTQLITGRGPPTWYDFWHILSRYGRYGPGLQSSIYASESNSLVISEPWTVGHGVIALPIFTDPVVVSFF